jgi:hypothetical protein
MTQATTRTPSFTRRRVFFSEIEFLSPEEVSLVGEIMVNGKKEFAQYITHKRNLYTLLKHSGKLGKEIIHLLISEFARPHAVPVKLDLTALYGKAVCLSSCLLKLDRSFYENEVGDWRVDYETNLFFIDAVKPLVTSEEGVALF